MTESDKSNAAAQAASGPREPEHSAQARFGMFTGVFTPCVLTILGVIMFMRSGFVVGHVGLWLGLVILGLSKLITTLTTLSLSAVVSNLKMRGGGVYFMISRVLGPDFGGSIGITLFLAQAVGVAFYVIGFTEAAVAVFDLGSLPIADSLPLRQILSTVVLTGLFALTFKGADVAIRAQYVVLALLLLSVASFAVGGVLAFDAGAFQELEGPAEGSGISFWTAFAIFFPAATGITAGVNMSGDLKRPGRDIPWGTLLAILFTVSIYVGQFVLIAGASPRQHLQSDPFAALREMSVFAPLVTVGVFAATVSSALGSFLGAPRILQAMGHDRLMLPMVFFGKGSGATNEPRRATVLTFAVAIAVVWAGDLNAVAEIISMFFLIAYGMINLSAFVESRGGNPSFRPKFHFFHWSLSLAGAIGCTVAMLKINDTYALVAIAVVALIYFYLRNRAVVTSYGDAKRGYIFQHTRENLQYLEQSPTHPKNWRPVLVALCEAPARQSQLIRVGSWLESERGLYTAVHLLLGADQDLPSSLRLRRDRREELRRQLAADDITAFAEAVFTRDRAAGIACFLQAHSLGGLRPNTLLVELPRSADSAEWDDFMRRLDVLAAFERNLVLLKSGDIAPHRKRRTIDLWWRGQKNGSLMALFAYLMTLDQTWSGAQVRLLRLVRSEAEAHEARRIVTALRDNARIVATVEIIRSDESPWEMIPRTSGATADVVMLGMSAAGGAEARQSLQTLRPMLEQLPTTLIVWSNGDANVFA